MVTWRTVSGSPTKLGPGRWPTTDAPMLSASSSNNHSLFSFGGKHGLPDDVTDTATSFDFLPSVSFDDLQSSLESASADFKLTQFPSPTGQGPILADRPLAAGNTMVERPDITRHTVASHAAAQQPPVTRSRTGSILRRPSTSSRHASISSTAPSNPGVQNAPTAPAAMRSRRQSHYPPVSNANIVKPPRKSTGDVAIGGEFEPRKRRPSVASLSDRNGLESTTRSSIDGGSRLAGDVLRAHTNSRTAKARSVQPPPRASQAMLSADTNTMSLDPGHTSTALPRSPRTSAKGPNPTGKRISVMPGAPQLPHATGLGARTISPTDTRRMQRLSMHHTQGQPTAPVLPNPPQLTADGRSSSRSPSILPRKISTPSSSRTTPDPNRKSYSSGLSITSNASVSTTVRTSTASVQQRNSQAASSRLPAPKVLGLHNSVSHDEEEDVPPVPAIPKAYESPKETFITEAGPLDKRKSNLAYDASSINSNSTGSVSGGVNEAPHAKTHRRASQRKSVHTSKLDMESKAVVSQTKKTLEPLRLPPITLGPLSTPTAARIAALQEQGSSDRNLSPPPARQIPKTPTTPMTASKSAFFRTRPEERTDVQHLRSSSSVYRFRRESPPPPEPTSSSESVTAVNNGNQRSGPSPFLSSSLPKGGHMETAFLKRSKTGGDFTLPLDNTAAAESTTHLSKPSGPRAEKTATARPAKSPPPLSSPDEPPTPSSMSSLRRKLSLSWKRSASKSGSSGQLQVEKSEHGTVKHDSMPPPRIPASVTLNSVNTGKPPSPTPSAKSSGAGTYLESRRRKSSASSLNAIIAQEQRGRSDGLGTAKKESTLDTVAERTTLAHNSSVVQKILKPRQSSAALRHHDVWTAELDKDDMIAEEEMMKLGLRRKDTELAARTLDALRKRATPKERVSPQEAIRIAVLNIYERGEIVDYKDVYFCGTQNAAKVVGDPQSDSPNFGYDDERGDYSIVPGDHLAYRYEIIDVLGKGSFGQVVRCIDHKTGALVAVKIIRNKKRFHQQALVEVNILQKLREWDPHNKHSMVNFTHSFYFRGHLCISTELLDMNLYEFIKSNAFRGFSLKMIRRFTKQMLSALNLLKQHKVIHCDLKPENILLRHPLHTEIKVIDFGSSCFENEKVYTYIQSRFYRSPEVILGMSYGMPIDMWSLGCILAELYTGVPIFPGENEQEQLACIMEVFGPPEKHLIEKSTRKKLFFDSMGKPRLTVSSKGRRRRPSSKTLQQVLKCDDEAFLDFIARCLRWDPDRRMKPEEAIRHEFITGQKSSVPVPRSAIRDSSPSKRVASLNAGPRPLPEPPAAAKSNPSSLRSRDAAAGFNAHHHNSPLKPGMAPSSTASTTRRTSGVVASSSSTTASASTAAPASTIPGLKRTSTGTGTGTAPHSNGASAAPSGPLSGSHSNSSLPRASMRSVSGSFAGVGGGAGAGGGVRQDLATAGASAAMGRRV
ncbi:31f800f6-6dd7-413f-9a40-143bde3d0651 [Thermothielavioides terrestris]|uniref:31f800f6-6dd7-413f-9a40-143bde3d0651 n=1 Tax=Thermothielavioides terrestris TaxID=2587410 RepID=A0A3S4D4C6_9PEZI|nr:31f800f6-6dd7-413f-9a40-143bde3d0651 [Thermothielavioides terrestris]